MDQMRPEPPAFAPAQPSLTRTELERRTRKRSKQAGLKIAAQRAQKREEREAAARRRAATNEYARHVREKTKSRKGRAGHVGRSGGRNGTKARPPRITDDSRKTHEHNAEYGSPARARTKTESIEGKLRSIVASLRRYRGTVRLAKERFADLCKVSGIGRVGLQPSTTEEVEEEAGWNWPTPPPPSVLEEDDAAKAFTAVAAAASEALSFAAAWQHEQQGGGVPTESSAGGKDGDGVESPSPSEDASEDELARASVPLLGAGGHPQKFPPSDGLVTAPATPDTSYSSEHSSEDELAQGPESPLGHPLKFPPSDGLAITSATPAPSLAQASVPLLGADGHPQKFPPSDGLVTAPATPDTSSSSEHSSEDEVRSGVRSAGGEEEPVDFCQEWPEYPWWPVLEDSIRMALNSMSLEELNDRMELHHAPLEPSVEELEGEDGMEFPPPPEAPVKDDAVIPARVFDDMLEDPDEIAMASLVEIEGSPKPDRDAVDATRRTAYDAANDFLARKRATRAPRRPSDRPPPNVKMLHRLEGFRCFSSMEQAVMEVTEAVLGEEGVWRGIGADLAETSLLDTRQVEEDEYFLKCQLAESMLEDLIADTMLECKRVYAFG